MGTENVNKCSQRREIDLYHFHKEREQEILHIFTADEETWTFFFLLSLDIQNLDS